LDITHIIWPRVRYTVSLVTLILLRIWHPCSSSQLPITKHIKILHLVSKLERKKSWSYQECYWYYRTS